MKVQNFWVLSLFIAAALTFVGCGETTTDGGGDSATTTETSDDGSADKEEASESAGEGSGDNASTAAPSGEFQMVSLNVPNMT